MFRDGSDLKKNPHKRVHLVNTLYYKIIIVVLYDKLFFVTCCISIISDLQTSARVLNSKLNP